ncbi:protein OS-9 isoform X2 [Rana temporaria]|uniref:protein OS-9 isoform X2 n=1 Tax=Rana temporaria TaxID=8407 RepID=UPI001AAD823B|nr:protein OS-9 isoform X2 [Rana temporaria]
MAVTGVWVQVCLLLWVLCGFTAASLGFLNLEELMEMKYGIEILSEPVIRGQSKADNIVTIASKYKQNYECKLPAIAVKFQQEKEEDTRAYSGLGISDLLKPMEAAPCLTKTKDWWTYEFCYGKHLQQYHIEESEVKGDILYLGYYQSEFDWDNETAKASKHHKLKRYHSQMYVNGSRCDLNGKSRETEVRFMCEEGSGDYIARVDEPQSCTYVLTIHTTRICNHPFLRPPSTGTPQSIRCQPALSPEQYVEYVKAQVSDTKRIVEELSEELKTLDLNTLPNKGSASSDHEKPLNIAETAEEHPQEESVEDSAVEDSAAAEIDEGGAKLEQEEAEIWNKISPSQDAETQMSDTEPTEGVFPNHNNPTEGAQGTHKTLRYKIIRNPEDLMKFIEDLKKPEKDEDKLSSESKEAQTETESSAVDELKNAEDEDEKALMQEFEKELENFLLPKSDVSQIKDNVKTEMAKEFNNIIDEAQEELETEGLKGEFDRKQATKSLATTLNKLIDKLDNAAEDKGEETEPGESNEVTTQGNNEPASKAPTDDHSDGRVKVRVTKIRRGSSEHTERRLKEMSSENPQMKLIENVVKDLLEKEGLKAQGKIEIKILTGGFGEDDDGHWLSEEDTKNLKEIFFNLLIHGTEDAHKEQKRQQQLEDNYRFVWNQNQDDTKSNSASTDSDDVDF